MVYSIKQYKLIELHRGVMKSTASSAARFMLQQFVPIVKPLMILGIKSCQCDWGKITTFHPKSMPWDHTTRFLRISYFEGQKLGKCNIFIDEIFFVYNVDRASIHHFCKFECKILLRSWARAIFPLKNGRENTTSKLLMSNTGPRPLCVLDVVSIA